jgi:hypothetical protein
MDLQDEDKDKDIMAMAAAAALDKSIGYLGAGGAGERGGGGGSHRNSFSESVGGSEFSGRGKSGNLGVHPPPGGMGGVGVGGVSRNMNIERRKSSFHETILENVRDEEEEAKDMDRGPPVTTTTSSTRPSSSQGIGGNTGMGPIGIPSRRPSFNGGML